MLRIHTIDFGTPEYDESVALRYTVLRQPLGLEFSPEQLAGEWSDIHIAAFSAAGEMIGILILTPIDADRIKMRQVAVAPQVQGKGVGGQMVGFSETHAKSLNIKLITLHARATAVPFYLNLGYTVVGEQFEEVGIPHFKMEKYI